MQLPTHTWKLGSAGYQEAVLEISDWNNEKRLD
jgi:hypothetical protein